jgi:hypothetical protein
METGFNVVPSVGRAYGTGWSEAFVSSGSYYRWNSNNLFNTGDLGNNGRYVAPADGYYITQANVRMDSVNIGSNAHMRRIEQ